MNTQQLARADYLDILFDGRNKTYGAFELRRHYAQRTRRALGVVLGITCLIAAYPLFAGNKPVVARPVTISTHFAEPPVMPPPPKKIEVRQPQQTPHAAAASLPKIEFKDLAVVRDAEVIKPPVIIDSLKGKIVSSNSTDGQIGGTENDFGPKIGTGGPGGPPTDLLAVGGTGRDPREIVNVVDQKPEFNGNIDTWLSNHLEYPERAASEGAHGSVMMQFVVNEDGSISDVSVLKGAGHGFEAEAARVIKMMPRWKPAKLNGEAVRTWFRLPVVFALADN